MIIARHDDPAARTDADASRRHDRAALKPMALSLRVPGGARLATWPVLELLVSVAVQLLLTPLLLHRLGPQQFGLWVIVQTALLASTALSFGASAGVLPVLSAVLHRGDVASARAAMHGFFRRLAAVSLGVLACTGVLMASGFMQGRVPAWAEAGFWPLVVAALAWMGCTEVDNAVSSALKAQGRFSLAAVTESVARVVQFGLVYLIVTSGSTALLAVLVSLGVTVVKALARMAALRPLLLPMDRVQAASAPARAAVRELAVTGAWVWAGALGSLAFNAFDRWFVAAWFGASTLAAYAICTQLTQLPHAVVAAASQVLVPWAARHTPGSTGSTADARALKLLGGATALAALPSLLLLPLLQPVLALWISPAFATEHLALARGLTVAFLLLCLNVPAYFLLLGMGQARYTTVVVSISGALFVAGALALPHDLSSFVVLKGLFAVLALALPVGCAWRLRARPAPAA